MAQSFGIKRAGLMAAAALFALSSAVLAQNVAPTNNLPNPYKSITDWAKMPTGRTWGASAGVDIDPDGKSVWVLDRCGANTCFGSNLDPILKFDASGKLVKAFGAGMFVFPHGIFVDRQGNVWVTDGQGRGSQGHQVIKFNPNGQVLMRLGVAFSTRTESSSNPGRSSAGRAASTSTRTTSSMLPIPNPNRFPATTMAGSAECALAAPRTAA